MCYEASIIKTDHYGGPYGNIYQKGNILTFDPIILLLRVHPTDNICTHVK